MPTMRATYPITIKAEVIISRDFYQNREKQLAEALYEELIRMNKEEAIDFLAERLSVLGEGLPYPEHNTAAP